MAEVQKTTLSGELSERFIDGLDRKSTRLNSSHDQISYAVFCLKKKNTECPSQLSTRRTLLHALRGCVLLMLKGRRLTLPVRWLLVPTCLTTISSSLI